MRATAALVALVAALAAEAVGAASITQLEFLGLATIPASAEGEAPIGGLSAITYDAIEDRYYTITDDPSFRAPSRFYTLTIDLEEGRLDAGGVEIVAVTTLLDRQGDPFAPMLIDGEGIVLTPERRLLISSEGNIDNDVAPSLRVIRLDGREVHEYHVPNRWLPREDEPWGARHNQAFESIAWVPETDSFLVATENALHQDGPAASVDESSRVRIARFDASSGRLLTSYVYRVDPVVAAPPTEGAFHTNGLVEILALDETNLLALERSFTLGVGNSVRLFLVSLEGAEDVRQIASLADRGELQEASKSLLVDLADLGTYIDNVEGMALGPTLADGRRTLLLISDDNFSSTQVTQLFAFALSDTPTSIPVLQGAGHRSPMEGRWVHEVRGVVTATDLEGRRAGFWMQSAAPDESPATAEGIFVHLGESAGSVTSGDLVSVGGRVRERERDGELSVTTIDAHRVEVISADHALPAAIALTEIPTVIDDDGLERFEPQRDAIDLYESLEGMRVTVPEATVTGPTSRFGTMTLAIGERGARTARGGLLLTTDDSNSNRLVVEGSLAGGLPDAAVGLALGTPAVGVLDYAFGHYRMIATQPLEIGARRSETPRDSYATRADCLNVASFNVENLDFGDSDDKFSRVAGVVSIQRPAIVALQEIQDDSGRADDGTVGAELTLGRLIEGVRALHGPDYAFVQVDPENNADGGAPGGNIRVAFLYDAESVRWIRHERLFSDHVAFLENPETGYEATRKPLLAEFEYDGERLVAINVHLKSKRGDDGIFGSRQPPVRHTERQRSAQARAIRDYVENLLDADPSARVLVLGDFNEHEFRDPMRLLEDSRLTNLIHRLPEGERYTYNFEGNSQSLDHILVSPALLEREITLEILRANADGAHAWRSSDHDPVYASLCPRPPVD